MSANSIPEIGSNITVRKIDGQIVNGVVTGHSPKDDGTIVDYETVHVFENGQTVKRTCWALPEQVIVAAA